VSYFSSFLCVPCLLSFLFFLCTAALSCSCGLLLSVLLLFIFFFFHGSKFAPLVFFFRSPSAYYYPNDFAFLPWHISFSTVTVRFFSGRPRMSLLVRPRCDIGRGQLGSFPGGVPFHPTSCFCHSIPFVHSVLFSAPLGFASLRLTFFRGASPDHSRTLNLLVSFV